MTYIINTLIALDQLANAVLNGDPDETLSSRAHRMRAKGQPVWGWTARAILRKGKGWPHPKAVG